MPTLRSVLFCCAGSTATLGLYINSGSVYEEPYETGAPQHLFKYRCMQHLTCRTAIRPFQ